MGYFKILELRSARVSKTALPIVAVCDSDALGRTVGQLAMQYGQVLVRPTTQEEFEEFKQRKDSLPLYPY